MHMHGSNVTVKDWAAAPKCFLLGYKCSMCRLGAAEHEYAMCSLGKVFRIEGCSLAQDLKAALTWFKKAEGRYDPAMA